MSKKKKDTNPHLLANRVTKGERTRIETSPTINLEAEIAYLRTIASRLALILEKNGLHYKATAPLNNDAIQTFLLQDRTFSCLLTCIKTHALLTDNESELDKEIEEGKHLARLDMSVYDYFTFSPPNEA